MLWYLLLQLLWQTPPYTEKSLLKSETVITKISFAQRTIFEIHNSCHRILDTNFYGHFISYIEWSYRISHAILLGVVVNRFLPSTWSTVSLPKQSRAPPTFSHPRHPRAPRLGSQIYSEDFFVSRDEAPYTRPMVWSSRRPCFKIQCKVFISDH